MLIFAPILMTVSAIWAVAPDLPRLFGNITLYHQLANDPRCNIFYWHYTIDKTEVDSPLYHAVLILLIASFLVALVRELKFSEAE